MTNDGARLKPAEVVARRLADDGSIPNNPELPLLVYRQAMDLSGGDPATSFEALFTANGWPAAWRNGIHPFHHFHSTAHEALGVYRGTATARFGGEGGVDMTVSAGDVVIIPAGVGHKALEASRTSASSVRTRPGPAPTSVEERRPSAPRASTRSRGSRCRSATPSTGPRDRFASTGPEPFRPGPRVSFSKGATENGRTPGHPAPARASSGTGRGSDSRCTCLFRDLAHRHPAPLGVG